MTARENVALAMMFAGVRARGTRRVCEACSSPMGLGGRQDHRPRELSGGEQQRVAIARALSNKPHLLLADEPTGNLDSHTSRDIMAILKDLNQREGKTIVMVTHDATLAGAYANRTITLLDGVVVNHRLSSTV